MKEKDYSISLLRMLAVISIIFCHSFEYSSSIFADKSWILRSIGNYLANGVQVFLIAVFLSVFSGIILYHICRKMEKLISLKKEKK